MGSTTRTAFEDEVRFVIGNQTNTDGLLDNWVNRALVRVAYFPGLIHPELQSASTLQTVAATTTSSVPDDFFAIDGLYHNTIHKELKFLSVHQWAKKDHTLEGSPTHYMIRSGIGNVRLFWWWPVLASGETTENMTLFYRRKVPLMDDPGDTSPLEDDYDQAIIHFASAFGFYALNEDERGDEHIQRALASVTQIQARNIEDTTPDDSGMPVVVEEVR